MGKDERVGGWQGRHEEERVRTYVQKKLEGSFLFRSAELTVLFWKGNAVNSACFKDPVGPHSGRPSVKEPRVQQGSLIILSRYLNSRG